MKRARYFALVVFLSVVASQAAFAEPLATLNGEHVEDDPSLYAGLAPARLPLDMRITLKAGTGQSDLQALEDWLRGQGFEIVAENPTGVAQSIEFNGSVEQAESAFHTRILASRDGSLYGNLDDPSFPARLANVIGGIMGLSTIGLGGGPIYVAPESSTTLQRGD